MFFRNLPLVLSGVILLFVGCAQETEWSGYQGGGSPAGGFFGNGGNNGGQSNGGFGNGDLTPADLANDLERQVDYPSLRFTGDGNVASIDSRNPTQVATEQEFSQTNIILRTTRFTSSDGTIDKRVRKLVGTTEFDRTSKQELITREDEDNFRNLPFIMYGSRSRATNGYGSNEITYSKPVPAAIIPLGPESYRELLQGPAVFNASVIESSGARFDIISTVLLAAQNGSIYTIRQVTEIQGNDSNGRLYDKLHLSWTAEYEIDTVNKKVISLYSNDYYYNEEKGRRNMTVKLQLCTYTLKGQSQSFPCPNY